MADFLNYTLGFDISLLDFLLMTAVIILGSSLQASAGFGSGLVAVPLLGLIDYRLVPCPILFAYLFLCSFMAWRERSEISLFHQKHLISGIAIGTFIALLLLFFISEDYFPLIAATLVLGGVGLSLFQSDINLNKSTLTFSGTLSGIMSTLAGLSGPPMALVLQFQQPAFIRANLALAFVFASTFSIIVLYFKSIFQMEDVFIGSFLIPGMFIGVLLGSPVSKLISAKHSRWLILSLASLSGISLLFKSLN
jgi:uncharacterized membrane protein YfcA